MNAVLSEPNDDLSPLIEYALCDSRGPIREQDLASRRIRRIVRSERRRLRDTLDVGVAQRCDDHRVSTREHGCRIEERSRCLFVEQVCEHDDE